MTIHVQWRDTAQNVLMWTVCGDYSDEALQQAYGRVAALLDSKGHPVDVVVDVQQSGTSIVPTHLLMMLTQLADSHIGKMIIVSTSAAWQTAYDELASTSEEYANASVHFVSNINAADAIIDMMRHQRPGLTPSL